GRRGGGAGRRSGGFELHFRQLRNRPTISSLIEIDLTLAVETQEKHNVRPPRRPARLRARLRCRDPLYAADPRLLRRDRLHHALSLGALCRRTVPAAEKAAGKV